MLVACDLEGEAITYAEPVPRMTCFQAYDGTGSGLLIHQSDPRLHDLLVSLFAEHHTTWAFPGFDIPVILRRFPDLWPVIRYAYESDRVHCVLTRDKLLAIADGKRRQLQPFSLENVAHRRCGIELAKGEDTWRMSYGRLIDTPISAWPQDAITYAMNDVYATRAVHVAQDHLRHTSYGDALYNEAHQVRTQLALAEQATIGLETDPVNAQALLRRMDLEIAELQRWTTQGGLAREHRGKTIRTRKAVEAAVAEFAEAMGRTPKRTKGDGIAVSKTALADLELPAAQYSCPRCGRANLKRRCECGSIEGVITWIHPVEAYRQLGGLTSLRSKWFPLLLHPRIFTRYSNPVDSGRTSSSGSSLAEFVECSENLQNFPRPTTYEGVRECVRAPAGCKLGISDWSGIEIGTMAQVALDRYGFSRFAEMLARGDDVHATIGSKFIGIDPASYDPKNPVHKKARQDAKPVTFGKMGLLGAVRLITFARDNYGVTLSKQQAEEYSRIWYDTVPEMRRYHDDIKAEVPFGQTVTVVQPRSLRIRGGCMATDAANTRFQGLAGDLAGSALWALYCEGRDPASILYGCRQVLFVHDENVTVIPDDYLAAARLARQDEVMLGAFAAWCPDVRMRVESGLHSHYTK